MKIAVGIVTCDRYDCTVETVESLLKHNDVLEWKLFYADDASTDERVRPFMHSRGFIPVVLNTRRHGCTPTSDMMIREIRGRTGDDWFLLYLQNDYRSVRPIPVANIEKMFDDPLIGSCRLWHKRVRIRNRARRAGWASMDLAGESVIVGKERFAWHAQLVPIPLVAALARNAPREATLKRRSKRRLERTVFLMDHACVHIGSHRTPGGIYRSPPGDAGRGNCISEEDGQKAVRGQPFIVTEVAAAGPPPRRRKGRVGVRRRRRRRLARAGMIRLPGLCGFSWIWPEERVAIAESLPVAGRVLEVGTLHGVTVASWAKALPHTRFVSVDPFVNQKQGAGGQENWMRNKQPNMALLVGTINDVAVAVPPHWFDFIVVDGDHTEAGCYHDLDVSQQLLAGGGTIAVHDYGHPKKPEVKVAVHRFCEEAGFAIVRTEKTMVWVTKKPMEQVFPEKAAPRCLHAP